MAFGKWKDPYTGRIFTDPSQLDIDHVIPLKEAWESGAKTWSRKKKREFANALDNPDHLIAVQLPQTDPRERKTHHSGCPQTPPITKNMLASGRKLRMNGD